MFLGLKQLFTELGIFLNKKELSCTDVRMKDLQQTNNGLCLGNFSMYLLNNSNVPSKRLMREIGTYLFFPLNRNMRAVIGSRIPMVYYFATGKTEIL